MTTIALASIALGILGFGYTYGGYAALLRGMSALFGRDRHPTGVEAYPGVTVFISMLNEEDNVESRLEDLLEQDFPLDQLEILVLSDGSTDETAERARRFADQHRECAIKVVENSTNQGKARMQNLAVREASHPILVSTDAETRFDPLCLRRLAEALTDPKVAIAGGRLVFHENGSALANGQAMYRRMEHRIRSAEDRLGIMTRADAVCMAYRRSVWEDIEDFEDADQVLTLVARKKGFVARHVGDAVCFDEPNTRPQQEVRARTRMTKKTLFGLEKHWGPSQWVRHPRFTWALFSHKIVRLLSPFFLGLIGLGCALLVADFYGPVAGIGALVVMIGTAAALVARPISSIRVVALVQALLVANLGFASGWMAYLKRDRFGGWVPSRRVTD